ncbi:MAG: N-formylglutamate amidohydrolase [Pseudomonadota bacterium]
MSEMAPFELYEPDGLVTNLVFDSPHSGAEYPKDLLQRSRLDPLTLRASEDALVDRLFAAVPRFGAPLLTANVPRAYLDLNRAPGELDPALIEGVRPSGLNQRIAAGLGVVPRIVSEGAAIYDGKISLAEAEERVRRLHAPYHQTLEGLLHRARDRFGSAVLYDCHSMPSEALRAAPRVRGRTPDIVLGDRFGASAARHIIGETQRAFEDAGFTVARNAPFAGGYITQRYGRPSRGIHAVQIEIDRGLYLDQTQVIAGPNFDEVASRLEQVIATLVEASGGVTALAAE